MTVWKIRGGGEPNGRVCVPGDKSVGHRAVMFASIAHGVSRVRGLPTGADVRSTMAVFRQLGVEMTLDEGTNEWVIVGHGIAGLSKGNCELDCGNSGTTMRLLSGLFSGIEGMSVALTGDESLSVRPMARVVGPLSDMGADIVAEGEGGTAPLRIKGTSLRAFQYWSPVASAQVKSALLLAGLSSGVNVKVAEPHLSRDHSERMLRARGCRVITEGEWIDFSPPETGLNAMDVRVPGDISSAAFFLALGAIGANEGLVVENVGINPTRTGVLDILEQMGAGLEVLSEDDASGEPTADLRVTRGPLRGIEVSGSVIPRCIDEIPVLAVVALFAEGVTSFRDVAELRVKETDRIHAMVTELSKMGARLEEFEDGFDVYGGVPLKGARMHSHGDHRIAMALCVASVFAEGESTIDGAEATDISFPEFTGLLNALFEAEAIEVCSAHSVR